MLNYLEFVSREKSMLIAPAGYGKTHTIAECLKHTQNNGKQLILTHTHAGVSSIKQKIKKEKIPNHSYSVETITSFAQKYVLSFYTGSDLPEQEDSKRYYPFIINKANELFKLAPIKRIILNTYTGIFIDEYQDCTKIQHDLISTLSELFPSRILGDYLQGIFDLNEESLVDMENMNEMGKFFETRYELDKPQRWLNGNNATLGNDLVELREILIKRQEIDLKQFSGIETIIADESDLYRPTTDYNKKLKGFLEEKNLLIIHPDSTSIYPRLKIIKLFNNRINLVESIDDKDFYNLAKEADLITAQNIAVKLKEISLKLFNKTGVDNWFNDKGFKKKTNPNDKLLLQSIERKLISSDEKISFSTISKILKEIKKLPEIKCYRKELFYSLCLSLEEAELNGLSIKQAMINRRNSVRRIGRKVYGKCIGTTLLTKGLEFDAVVIINAHKFDCPKHLYVALTRGSKRLIIFSNSTKLNPYKTS